MKKIITTALAPNIEPDDRQLARSLLFHPDQWFDGLSVAKLEQAFHKELDRSCFAVSSGRTGLYGLLKMFGVSEGDEVCLQAYTCIAVPAPVLWLGAKPVYIDINPATYNIDCTDLEKKLTQKCKVIVVQHTFGLAADLEPILALAGERGIMVIEDCAHAIRAVYQGLAVGTFGDASFFSFGRDKVISGTFGGLVAIKNKQYAENFRLWRDQLPYPSKSWVRQQLIQPIVTSWLRDHLHWGLVTKILMSLTRLLGVRTKAVEPNERKGARPSHVPTRLPEALAKLTLRQLQKLNTFITHRQSLARFYDQTLRDFPIQRPPLNPEHTYLRYTIQVKKRDDLVQYAQKHGIILGDWYITPIAPADTDYRAVGYLKGSCPQAESAASQSINLPTSPIINLNEAQRIVHVINQWYQLSKK